ncbi:hypothetical protein DFP72DRAFT_1067995 [Ephemerocybe angulata]|uniref:Uncharacterized protein n=1 Tax=Ephemerocybe angulata TaxID=980116 RepID=A0A8H6HYJ9_9AGAR|nr:hypothetical protein DFP72DRAFT_1067995 [Tulosesus angulatus]
MGSTPDKRSPFEEHPKEGSEIICEGGMARLMARMQLWKPNFIVVYSMHKKGTADLADDSCIHHFLAQRTTYHAKLTKVKSAPPEKIFDINTLGAHYRKEGVLVFKKDRSQPYKAIDEFGQGMNILAGGKLKAFLLRTMNDGPVMETDHEEDEAEILDASQLPVNPVVSLGVAMEASDFVEPTEVY